MKLPTPANMNTKNHLGKIDRLTSQVGGLCDGRHKIIGNMVDDIDWTCSGIYEACFDGKKRLAFSLLKKLKGQVAKFDSVTAILAK